MSLVAISTLFFKLLDSVEKGRSYEKILKKFNRDRKIHGTSENKLDEGDWSTTYNASRDTGRMLKDFVGDKNMKSELEEKRRTENTSTLSLMKSITLIYRCYIEWATDGRVCLMTIAAVDSVVVRTSS
jgi:hypothetical protein